jgi:hypothetical protein
MATHGMVRCLQLYLVQLAVRSVTKTDKMRKGFPDHLWATVVMGILID